jgi:hypothetical protein
MAASRELPRLCSWLLSAFIASNPASPDGAPSCWPMPPLTRTCTGAGEGCTNEGASPLVIPRKLGFGPRADLIAGSTAQAQDRRSPERQRPAVFRRVSKETLSSNHAAAVHIRPTHQSGIQRSCEGTRRPGVPAPPTRGANSTCRWRAHAVGQRQRGLAQLQPQRHYYASRCRLRLFVLDAAQDLEVLLRNPHQLALAVLLVQALPKAAPTDRQGHVIAEGIESCCRG